MSARVLRVNATGAVPPRKEDTKRYDVGQNDVLRVCRLCIGRGLVSRSSATGHRRLIVAG